MSSREEEARTRIEAHNSEAQFVWEAFHAGRPSRPPVALGTDTRFFLFNEELNPSERLTFEDYATDGVEMLRSQLRAAEWRADWIAPFCDDLVGVPETFSLSVDLQTYDDAGFFGAPVILCRIRSLIPGPS